MKQLFILFLLLSLQVGTSFAQRVVYVDTEYVLDNLTEYQAAKEKLEMYTQEWTQEIVTKEQELIDMKVKFQQNELLMPAVEKEEQEALIAKAESDLAALKQKRFGVRGDLYKMQQDLIKPIQDKVYNAVKQMAEYRDYDIVLDKATGVSILFAKPKFDMSDEVLRIINGKNN